jgi:hypothetical protein
VSRFGNGECKPVTPLSPSVPTPASATEPIDTAPP